MDESKSMLKPTATDTGVEISKSLPVIELDIEDIGEGIAVDSASGAETITGSASPTL